LSAIPRYRRPITTTRVPPRGPYTGGAPLRPFRWPGGPIPPTIPPRLIREFPRFPRANALVVVALASFLVGQLIGELIPLGPWATPVNPDPRTMGPRGEIEPPERAPDWGPENGSPPDSYFPEVEPPWWPTGETAISGATEIVVTAAASGRDPATLQIVEGPPFESVVGSLDVVGVTPAPSLPSIGTTPYGDPIASPLRITITHKDGSAEIRPAVGTSGTTTGLRLIGIRLRPGQAGAPSKPAPAWKPERAPRFNPQPRTTPAEPQPQPQPNTEPQRRTLPVPAPAPIPMPIPGTAPLAPRPGGVPLPATTPKVAPKPAETTKTAPDGKPIPKPAELPVTPKWLEVPWPGADPIGQPSQRPAEDIPGLVREVGKLEQKLGQLGDRLAGGEEGGALGELFKQLRDIIEKLTKDTYSYPANSYFLEPVCDYNQDGTPIDPKIAQWLGGNGEFAEINSKLDALAELLQYSKELKQPICRSSPVRPVGEPVTVTFEEVG